MELFPGIVVPAEYGNAVRAEWEREAEEARWLEETIAWLDDPSNWQDESYSDIFKDVYGFRPRFMRGRGYWSY